MNVRAQMFKWSRHSALLFYFRFFTNDFQEIIAASLMLARLKAWFLWRWRCGDNILNLEWTQTFFPGEKKEKKKTNRKELHTLWSAAKSSAWSDEFQDASVASMFERVPNGARTWRILSKLQILKRTVSSTGAVRLSSSRNALFIGGVYDENLNMSSLKVPFLPLIPIYTQSQVKWSSSLIFSKPDDSVFASLLYLCWNVRRSESSKTDLEIEWWMELELAWTLFNSTKREHNNNTPSWEKPKAKRVMS